LLYLWKVHSKFSGDYAWSPNWTDNCIYQIECDFDFSKDDLLAELATLERKALERVKHGMEPQQGRDR